MKSRTQTNFWRLSLRLSFIVGSLSFLLCEGFAQTPKATNLTFTNLQGKVFSNVNVLKIEKDGILFRYGSEFRYDRVKFTNISETVQLRLGYDAKKIAQEEQARVEATLEQYRQRTAARDRKRNEALREAAQLIDPIRPSDFPKDTNSTAICRQAVYELKGLHTAIDLGLSYQKYSDLLTDTAISIGKIKDNNQAAFPPRFAQEMNSALAAFTGARTFWKQKIEVTSSKRLEEVAEMLLQQKWKEATLSLTYCIAMAEQRTNIVETASQQAAQILVFRERLGREGFGGSEAFSGLDDSDITALFNEYLKTNTVITLDALK